MSLRFTSRLVVALFLLSTMAQPQSTPPNYSSQGSEKTKKGDKSGKEEKPPEGESLKEIKTTKGPGLAADPTAVVVEMTNGDRLSGTGMQIKGGQFKMHADLAGDVSIPVTQVKTFTLADQVMVITKEGVMVANKVSMEKPGQVQLDQASTARTIPANTIRGIYPKTEYDHQFSEGWKPWLGWRGAITGGLSLVDGGDLSSTYTQDVHATREVPDVAGLPVKTRTNFSLGTQMGHGSTTGFRFRVFDAGLRQDFFTSARGFPFVYAQLDHIYSQKLYLQQLYGGGYGYDLVRRSNWHFTAESGLLSVHDHFFSPFPSSANAAALLGEDLEVRLGERSRIKHSLQFEPGLTQRGFYILRTDTAFTTKLTSRIAYHVSVRDLYLSQVPGANPKKNSLTLSTGLGFNF